MARVSELRWMAVVVVVARPSQWTFVWLWNSQLLGNMVKITSPNGIRSTFVFRAFARAVASFGVVFASHQRGRSCDNTR